MFFPLVVIFLFANPSLSEFLPLYGGGGGGGGGGEQDEEKRLYNFGLGKRAYSYVSEYKRLPVYNFGLGKRAGGVDAARNVYAFGLGKRRPGDYEEYAHAPAAEGSDTFREEAAADFLDVVGPTDKRRPAKSYDFGLGKRRVPADAIAAYNFGLGKKAAPQQHYSFGLGKRVGHYNFGLGKRQGKYSFGLGKKDKVYSFGLGKKRNYKTAAASNDDDDDELAEYFQSSPFMATEEEVLEEKSAPYFLNEKRDDRLRAVENAEDFLQAPPLSERQRSTHFYGFGLGKRSVDDAAAAAAAAAAAELPTTSIIRLNASPKDQQQHLNSRINKKESE